MSNKVVLFLVEGQSEINALERIFDFLCDLISDGCVVKFVSTDGDITTKETVTLNNINAKIGSYFWKNSKLCGDSFLELKDITQIIHLFDMDGAYIPDDHIICDKNSLSNENVKYEINRIIADNIEKFIERNERKRRHMDFLLEQKMISIKRVKIPYKCYFFSSNLDHFLYDEQNLTKTEKIGKAIDFSKEFANIYDDAEKVNAFQKRIKSIQGKRYLKLNLDYEASWHFVKDRTSCHSLERLSNIDVLLNDLKNILS